MENIASREMRLTQSFKTTSEQMWEVWTNPNHIKNWWGPNGFTNTILKMDLQEGGEWIFTMHGPDGTNFPNRSVFKEILPLEKIVFEHFNPHFITTVLIEQRGSEISLDWSMLFDTEEMRDIIIKAHKADEGLKENLEKLDRYLLKL